MCLARLLLLGLYVGNIFILYVNSGPETELEKTYSPVINLKSFLYETYRYYIFYCKILPTVYKIFRLNLLYYPIS